jgi:hypothetical protein
MMEALSSSETLVFTRATRHDIPEDGILYMVVEPFLDNVRTSVTIICIFGQPVHIQRVYHLRMMVVHM